MGKRELLLAGVFVLAGFLVYQFTAPPADPSKPGFSFSNLLNEVRREIRGQSASAEHRTTTPIPVSAGTREVRIMMASGPVTITGEDRNDIQAELHVRSSGYDDAEATQLAKATELKVDDAGALLILNVHFPTGGRQTATLTLRVPSRLGLRMDGKSGVLQASNLASVTIGTARGETTITGISGAVSLTQRGQKLTIDNVGSLRLQTTGGVEARVSKVRGEAAFNLQSGELTAEQLEGALEVEARSAEMHFQRIDKLRGPVRINAAQGELTITGLRTEARIDGRETEIRVEAGAAAPLAIYNDGGEPIELTVPAGGFKVDALATRGRITVDDALAKAGLTAPAAPPEGTPATPESRESRLAGAVRGGGPTLILRNTRGDIALRSK